MGASSLPGINDDRVTLRQVLNVQVQDMFLDRLEQIHS